MTHNIHPSLRGAAVGIGKVKPFPGNARRHDLAELAASLEATGQYRPVVVNKRTRHVLAGNGTFLAARRLHWTHIAVTWVDVPHDQEARLVLADNRTHELGGYNDAALLDLLQARTDDLTGTGYAADFVDALERDLATIDIPPSPVDPDEAVERAAHRYHLTDSRQLVLVLLAAEHDRMVADLDVLKQPDESYSAVVLRVVTDATGAAA